MSLVERLNIGAVACLPAGIAAFLLANRLLSPMLAGRADLEVSAMFWTWFGLAILSLLRPVRRAWIETLAISALLFAAVPIVDMATTGGIRFEGLFLAFDATMILLAVMLGFAAWRVAAKPAWLAQPRKRASVTVPEVREALDVA